MAGEGFVNKTKEKKGTRKGDVGTTRRRHAMTGVEKQRVDTRHSIIIIVEEQQGADDQAYNHRSWF